MTLARSRRLKIPASILFSLATTTITCAQSPQPPLHIRSVAVPNRPFTVAGPSGVLLGRQDGTLEAWVLPVKLLSQLRLTARVDGYPVPLELNPMAAEIDVTPAHTTITYTHIAVTVRQTMFAPEAGSAGAVVVFSIESTRPVTLTVSFTPEMRPMWPQLGPGGTPSPEWVPAASAYLLHTDSPDVTGAVALPTAQPGILAPYQEAPPPPGQEHPLEFILRYDPARDRGTTYPLLMAVGRTAATATSAALLAQLAELKQNYQKDFAANEAHYAALANDLTSIHTPDPALNDAFSWASVSIEQLRARIPNGQTGLVAGYFGSGSSARPGFGWFFGRDTLYTVPAIDAFGDFRLTRESLDFLIARQRADGKMMHEYSQTAGELTGEQAWAKTPYFYAAADATPLFLLAMLDYVQTSGDLAYLQQNRQAILNAWHFESTHDTDGDGIYDNAQGTGWVESWPGGQPHQEIYLALLDRQASTAMATLAKMLNQPAIAERARTRASQLDATIEREYYQPAAGDYAFSRNADGSLDHAATLYPTLAYWAGGKGLAHPQSSLRRWNSHDFSTDWGARDVAESDPFYDPISYHQGSVWPLFTGWLTVADYRNQQPLAGYAALRHNADQTYTQDLGAVTELLSGAFFTQFGRSTSHQLWSSAMVITPTIKGLFGLTVDAANHTVIVAPQLPADWATASVQNLHVGASTCTLTFTRQGSNLEVQSTTIAGPTVQLAPGSLSTQAMPSAQSTPPFGHLSLPLPAIEAALYQPLPEPGARTTQTKVLSEQSTPTSLTLDLEGEAGTTIELLIRTNLQDKSATNLTATGATLGPARLDGLLPATIIFPTGQGYVSAHIVLTPKPAL